MSELYEAMSEAIRAERPVALATVIEGENLGAKLLVRPDAEALGGLGHPDLDRVVTRDALGELEAGRTLVRHYGAEGQAREEAVSVFIESFAPPPQMLIFGAVDFTAALARVAKVLGYRVTVCDARAVFATRARFPMADEVVVDWPNRLLEEVGPVAGAAGRRVRAHPRSQVRRAGGDRVAQDPGRLHRGHGLAPHHRRPQPAPRRGGHGSG